MDRLISVIVPVYNVEKYLVNCFTSISKQTYTNIEIILVDDGSKDSSGAICDELQKQDSRVKVIHKKNEGLGFARNSGLDIASGEFVMFVDSDDYINVNMIERLYQRIREFKVDTSFCGYSVFFEDGKTINKRSFYTDSVFEGKEIIQKVLLEMIAGEPTAKIDAIIPMSVWHALYSMQLIRDNVIRFPSERQYMSEDIIFDIAYLQRANKVSYIGDELYNYRQVSSGSLTHIFKSDELARQIIMYEKINEELQKFLPSEQYQLRTMRYFLGRVRTCIDKAVSEGEYDKSFDVKRYVRSCFNNETVRKVINKYPYRKNPLKIKLFNICVKYKLASIAVLLIKMRRSGGNNRF